MKDVPTKLEKYLKTLEEAEAGKKRQFFIQLAERAEAANLQNPRHWAMRMVLSGRSEGEIESRFQKLADRKIDTD